MCWCQFYLFNSTSTHFEVLSLTSFNLVKFILFKLSWSSLQLLFVFINRFICFFSLLLSTLSTNQNKIFSWLNSYMPRWVLLLQKRKVRNVQRQRRWRARQQDIVVQWFQQKNLRALEINAQFNSRTSSSSNFSFEVICSNSLKSSIGKSKDHSLIDDSHVLSKVEFSISLSNVAFIDVNKIPSLLSRVIWINLIKFMFKWSIENWRRRFHLLKMFKRRIKFSQIR